MAELATIARPYAEALRQVAHSDFAGDIATQLESLAVIADSPALKQFADSPKATPEQVAGVITSVANVPLAGVARNLLVTLIENGRLTALAEVARQFRALVNAGSGVSDATIYSAYAIDDTALADVLVPLERRFGRKLKATVVVEPALIGGIRVVVGDEVLDTSVKARLEQMKVALTA